MNIERVFAATKREAIDEVRRRLGRGAIIVSDKRTTHGIEMVAMNDYDAGLVTSAAGMLAKEQAGANNTAALGPEHVGPKVGVETAKKAHRAAETSAANVRGSMEPSGFAIHAELRGLRSLVENHLGALAWNEAIREQPYRAVLLQRTPRIRRQPGAVSRPRRCLHHRAERRTCLASRNATATLQSSA